MDHVNHPLPHIQPSQSLREHLLAACRHAESQSPNGPETATQAIWTYIRPACSESDVGRAYLAVFMSLISDLLAAGQAPGAWQDDFPELARAMGVHAER